MLFRSLSCVDEVDGKVGGGRLAGQFIEPKNGLDRPASFVLLIRMFGASSERGV